MERSVSPRQQASSLEDLWSPRVVAEFEDSYVKVAKVRGEFTWHSHDGEDELFYILRGGLVIEMEGTAVRLSEGDLVVVPKGVRHRPVADEECHLMLIERKTTLHTGSEVTEMTRSVNEQLGAFPRGGEVRDDFDSAPAHPGAALHTGSESESVRPALRAVDHIHVHVGNRARAIQWYERVLGFRPRGSTPDEPDRPQLISREGLRTEIALFELPPVAGQHAVVAFATPGPDFDRWRQALNEAGVAFEEADHDSVRSLYFRDPDGNPFEITEAG